MVVSSHVDAGNLGLKEQQCFSQLSSSTFKKRCEHRGSKPTSSYLQDKCSPTELSPYPADLVLNTRARRDFTSSAIELVKGIMHLTFGQVPQFELGMFLDVEGLVLSLGC